MDAEIFRAENLPRMQRYGEALEAGIVRGNMDSLVGLKLGPGLELAAHAREHEHVGVVLAGEFGLTDGGEETVLRAGDLYRVPSNARHSVRCRTTPSLCRREPIFRWGRARRSSGEAEGPGINDKVRRAVDRGVDAVRDKE